ncbi:MAG: S41 family peptidase [Chloroflexi bacterium]|nr:S41 family peptidase [Chloroflexota bacterium]
MRPPFDSRFVRVLLAVLVLGFAVGLGFTGGMATMWLAQRAGNGPISAATATPSPADQLEVRQDGLDRLEKILDILQDEYYEAADLDEVQLLQRAAGGLVAGVGDPYTMYVEPVQASVLAEDMQGTFEGIGATVNLHEEGLVIVQIQPGSPALKAQLVAGDIILKADDQDLAGLDLTEAVALIRGPAGTVVRLLVRREGVTEPFVVPVTRARVETQIIDARMLDEGVAYLYLAEFNALSHDRVRESLQDLLKQDPTSLILDLRGNPGGLLEMAINVASEFLPRGTLVVTQRWSDGSEQAYSVRIRGTAPDIPMAVLINGGSASASEIVAGALRDHQRATLIGEPTYGKGAVQNVHALDDGSSLRVTVSKYFMPNGESPDMNPIEPAIAIAYTAEDMTAGTDPQLDRAVEFLLTGK